MNCWRWTLPFLFALLFWASFHPLDWGFLGWVSLVPLLVYAKTTSGKRSFFVAWLGGSLAFTLCFLWVRFTVPVGPYLLGIYKGLYVALFVLIVRRVGVLWSPLVWTALEYVRGYLFGGLPWFLLGYTQHESLRMIQVADLGGVWLVTLLVAAVNAAMVEGSRRVKAGVAALLVAAWVYGAVRIESIPLREGPLVALIQPNIPQEIKLGQLVGKGEAPDPFKEALRLYQIHLDLTMKAAEQRPALIVWPEAALYYGLEWNPDEKRWVQGGWYRRVLNSAEVSRTRTLVGLLVGDRAGKGKPVFTNSAVYVDPEKGILERFDKVHLVPFAEYVPFGLKDLVFKYSGLKLEDMRPGPGFPMWDLEGEKFGAQICFEAIFPEISREIAGNGASFTVNISNDGWFRDSAELDQMQAMARFRAIENRMHFIRATNTGISAFIEPTGRVQAIIPGKEVQGVLVARPKVTASTSLFRRTGNGVAWLAVLGVLAGLVRRFFVDRKKQAA